MRCAKKIDVSGSWELGVADLQTFWYADISLSFLAGSYLQKFPNTLQKTSGRVQNFENILHTIFVFGTTGPLTHMMIGGISIELQTLPSLHLWLYNTLPHSFIVDNTEHFKTLPERLEAQVQKYHRWKHYTQNKETWPLAQVHHYLLCDFGQFICYLWTLVSSPIYKLELLGDLLGHFFIQPSGKLKLYSWKSW